MLGIALVVEDANHGQRLAFRYPATSRVGQGSNTERDQKDRDKHDNNPYAWLGKEYEEDIYGSEQDATSSSSASSLFFDSDPTFFAQLFRPKNEMCNKRKSMYLPQQSLSSNSSLTNF